MPSLDQRVWDLLDPLYAGPLDGRAWNLFMRRLQLAISPEASVVFAAQAQPGRPGVVSGSDVDPSPWSLDDFLRPSVRHPAAHQLPAGSVIELPVGPGRFSESRLFREMLAPAGILAAPGLAVVIERDAEYVRAALLVLPKARGWKPRAEDHALLSRLAPHITNARRLRVQLSEQSRDSEALVAAFDRLALGVVFVDDRARVSYANRSAAEIFGVRSGFASLAELSQDGSDERTRSLAGLIESDRSSGKRIFSHERAEGPLQVLATPFRWGRGGGLDRRYFARALFLGDPKRHTGDPIGVLRELYGLTRGESRLAILLLGGSSVEEAAELLHISVGTARGVLKKVFEKTGTNRQPALVRLLLTGFGQVRAREEETVRRSA